MSGVRNPPLASASSTVLAPATVAKGALRRLAQAQLEPTPENYARAYADEAGLLRPATNTSVAATAVAAEASAGSTSAPATEAPTAPTPTPAGPAWASLIERLARNLGRGGPQWTAARRQDSLQRVLNGSRSDASRLLQRLQGLITAWENDGGADLVALGLEDLPVDAPAYAALCQTTVAIAVPAPATASTTANTPGSDSGAWPPLFDSLQDTVRAGLQLEDPRAKVLADELAVLADAVAADGATAAHLAAVQAVCERVQRLFAHRHHLTDQLGGLCHELARGLTELAEDDSWARGQCESLQARLADGGGLPSARGVRAATELLAHTRQRQQQLRGERQAAQTAFKTLIQRMISESGELGDHAGRFQQAVAQHAVAIESADSLESLAGVVRDMLDDSRAVQSAVNATRERLQKDQAQARGLEQRVRELEGELRRLSDEVATDALTQVANRRGLAQAFEALVAAQAQAADPSPADALAVGLLDIDNFKKLNDSLGHAAGDVALQSLAKAVRDRLRPVDHLARYGGEEFVVLLPGTALAEAQHALTRLQRGLSAGLFMHDGKEVFVTFSAGVTAWLPGESLQAALERADEALYEAKRTGKNRTCMA